MAFIKIDCLLFQFVAINRIFGQMAEFNSIASIECGHAAAAANTASWCRCLVLASLLLLLLNCSPNIGIVAIPIAAAAAFIHWECDCCE